MRLLARTAVLALAAAATPALARQTPPTVRADAPTPLGTPADLTPPEAPIDPATADAAAASLTDAPLPAEPRDKYEGINRAVWGVNQALDRAVIRPVAVVYRFVTPRPARRGLSRIFANLNEPWSFVNNLLQGKPGRAVNNLGRFVVNTTIGVAGLGDPASDLGIRPAPEDFGQTLAVWGVKNSAYIVLPLFGPSTVRDGIGTGIASFADPYPVCLQRCTNLKFVERLGIQAGEVVSIRSDLIESGADAFLKSSLDSYAAARSAYLQGRAAAIVDADEGSGTAGETPASVDPTTADAPPESGSPAAVPTADEPAASTADPAAPAPEPTAAALPKLSFDFAFNLDRSEG